MRNYRVVHENKDAGRFRKGRRPNPLWSLVLVPAGLALAWWWKRKHDQGRDGIGSGWVQTGSTAQTGGQSSGSSGSGSGTPT